MKLAETFTSHLRVRVRYFIYQPKVVLRIKGVVLIYHGRGEHADMYEHFARYLLDRGYVVVVSDIVGHGQSLIDFEQGYFGKEKGIDYLVKDIAKLQSIIRRRFDEAPFFMMGVDFGSLLVRKYMSEYGEYVEGALLLGTLANVKYTWIKKKYFELLRLLKGPLYKNAVFRHILHRGQKVNVSHWESNDEDEMQKYLNDPMRNFVYTAQGYRDFLSLVSEVNTETSISKIPDFISLYVAKGKHDKIDYGMNKLVEKYKKRPIRDFTYREFENCGHTLIFDSHKREVYKDIVKWLDERTYL